MPGRVTSGVYGCCPVTKLLPSTFFGVVPRTVHDSRGAIGDSARTTPVSFRPLTSSPNPADRACAATRPSRHVTAERSTLHNAAARSINISRAVAAARASTGAIRGVESDPNVPWSNGTRSVSAMTSDTLASGTRSSSAIACASDVLMF
jgi:hypothetical protein